MRKWSLTALTALVFAVGCGRQETVDDLMAKAQAHVEAREFTEAAQVLSDVLGRDDLAERRGRVFQALLGMHLQAERPAEAELVYRDTLARDPELAQEGSGVIGAYYLARGDQEALAAWTATLLAGDPHESALARLVAWNASANLRLDRTEALMVSLPALATRLGEAELANVLQFLLQTASGADRLDAYAAFLDALTAQVADDAVQRGVCRVAALNLAIVRGDWEAADARLRESAAGMRDQDISRALASMTDRAASTAEWDRMAALCVFALDDLADKPATRRQAALNWVRLAVRGGNLHAALSRTASLLERGLDPDTVMTAYRSIFYDVIGTENRPDIPRLIELGDRIAAALPADAVAARNVLNTLLFDGAFMVDDYDRVLTYLEQGLVDKDEDWYAMAANKVRAHKALRDGDLAEAVTRFRAFMDYVDRTWTEPEVDPSTGMRFTRDMSLGFNAKRIADILSDMGDAGEAAATYAVARRHYEAALAELAPDGKEAEHVRGLLRELPAEDEAAALAP